MKTIDLIKDKTEQIGFWGTVDKQYLIMLLEENADKELLRTHQIKDIVPYDKNNFLVKWEKRYDRP